MVRSSLRKSALVLGTVAGACLVRFALEDLLHGSVPFVLFLGSVALSTKWGGWRAGAAATVLSLVLGTFLFASPQGGWLYDQLADVINAAFFLFASFLIVWSLTAEANARKELEVRDASLVEAMSIREKLQRELESARRLEAIGRLAGGVAHDFNNLLTVIIGSTELLREESPNDELIEGMSIAAARGADLTKQLLGFARKQMMDMVPMNPNTAIEEVTGMAKRLIPEDIRIDVDLIPEPWYFEGDATQIQQVLLNLITNARDALPNGGVVQIRTGNVTLDRSFTKHHPEVTPGEYVHISVADDGVGMDEDLCRRVFEPFFTTKQKGSGTGLGLAVAYGIVKQLRGHITVASQPDKGSRFDIYLPRSKAIAGVMETTPALSGPRSRALDVLLVEDDDLVRSVTEAMLRGLGHNVISADNGAQALQIVHDPSRSIDLLLTDVVMPWMNGGELADRVRSMRPEVRVAFMSGYTDNVVLQRGAIKPGVVLLKKPFTAAELERALHRVTSEVAQAG